MNKYDRKHLANIASIQKRIETIYTQAAKEAARIGVRIDSLPADRLFSLDDYPAAKKEIDKLIKELADSVNVAIVNGIRSSWTLSNNKNDEISRQVFGDNVGKLTEAQYKRYFSTNGQALDAFLERKRNGLNLSDRVWRYTEAFRNEIELGLDVGIRNGMSAAEMSRDLRDWLRYPDMLFRRVRDEHGDLQLSQRAAMFHPGQGVYRSSYMNARRLAATETNIAYRTADHERWRDLDFVVGIRIVLSNNHTCLGRDGKPHKFEDICDKLSAEYGSTNTSGQGCYPKDFKFTGWHPHCRCHAESILKTDEEIAEDNRRILEGDEPMDYKQSKKYVKDVPKEFEEWVKANDERITKANSVPYFMSDNPKYTGITQKHGSVGAVTGTKLGRTATKYALKAYDGAPVAILTEDVIRNTSDIAQAMNLGKPKPMTFMDANQGRGNTLYGKDQSYSDNCQSAVVVHEARIRGLNVTSLGYDHNKSSVSYKLGERFEDIWENPKTRKTPSPTKIIDKSFDSMVSKINSNTKSVGRYHIGVNFADGGHMITAERLSDGKLIFYDPQCGDFISIEEYANYSVKYFELLKVDKLLIKKDMFTAIARRF